MTMEWLLRELNTQGVGRQEEVFLAELDTTGKLIISPCENEGKNLPD